MAQKHPHDYFIEVNNRLPTMAEFYQMNPPHLDCDHKEAKDGFGLAGGGYGMYMYCDACGRMLCKDEVGEL